MLKEYEQVGCDQKQDLKVRTSRNTIKDQDQELARILTQLPKKVKNTGAFEGYHGDDVV